MSKISLSNQYQYIKDKDHHKDQPVAFLELVSVAILCMKQESFSDKLLIEMI